MTVATRYRRRRDGILEHRDGRRPRARNTPAWTALDEWRTVRRRIRELERARQLRDHAA